MPRRRQLLCRLVAADHTHPGLEIDQDGSRNVPCVVALVVEDVLAVAALGRKVLKRAVLADSVLLAELLPELAANCKRIMVSISTKQKASQPRPPRKQGCSVVCARSAQRVGREGMGLTVVAALSSLDRDDFPARPSGADCGLA